jgi:tripartite-type tricarboxylate transporter receptor subunit TctC
MRRLFLKGLCCTALLLAPLAAAAQNYPDRTVHMIVPFPAGATMDFVMRLVCQHMTEDWGQSVVVDNRTGAAGIVGTEAGAKATPDGYTLLSVANSFAANPTLRTDLPYDTFKDLAPIGLIGSTPLVLVSSASVPANTMAELVALAKREPGKLTYGAAAGASPHLAMAWLNSFAGINVQFIPYRGQAQAQNDLLSGQIDLAFGNLPDILPSVSAGKLKAYGIATPERSALAPAIPTLAETGYKGPVWDSWYGMLAPAHTPVDIIGKISTELRKVIQRPDVKAKLSQVGVIPVDSTPEQFAAFLQTTAADYAKIIKAAGIHLE